MTLSSLLRPLGSILGCGLLFSLSGCNPNDSITEVSRSLAETVLVPAYQQWADTNQVLVRTTQAYCQGQLSLTETRQSFLNTQMAWASLQPMLLGPNHQPNHTWQVQFWPDPQNLVAAQVQALLQAIPLPTKEDIKQESIITRTLTAYEYLVFDPNLNLEQAQQRPGYCALAIAISEYQQQQANQLLNEWQEGSHSMAAQLIDFPNQRYTNAQQALLELQYVQLSTLDNLKKKLSVPLGLYSNHIVQPHLAEAWRSGASLSLISTELSSLEQLWYGSQEMGLRYIVATHQEHLATRLDQAYAEVDKQLQRLEGQSFESLLSHPEGQAELHRLYEKLNTLYQLHQNELAQVWNSPLTP